jgi:hypothetical protein
LGSGAMGSSFPQEMITVTIKQIAKNLLMSFIIE